MEKLRSKIRNAVVSGNLLAGHVIQTVRLDPS